MARSTLFSRNHSTLLLTKKRRLTNAIGDLLLKNFAIFTRKHVLKQACNFIKKKLQQSSCKCWEISKKPVLKNTCVRLLLKRLQEVIDQDFLSGESLSKPSRLSNITKIPVAFKPEPSLNLTPTLYFELRFPIFIISGYDRKKNACSPWTSCQNHSLRRILVRRAFTTLQCIYTGNISEKISANPKKQSNTLKQFVGCQTPNCLSVFDHFVELALYWICFTESYTSPQNSIKKSTIIILLL